MTIQKVGLDFFPLNVNLEQDDKFALIEAKYGIIGFAVLIKMYSKIYADKGYYCQWNEDIQLLFSSKINLERSKVLEIINDAIKWKIFDKDKFDKYKILTSRRIQENYLEITKRRLRISMYTEFLFNGINVNIINQNVNIISLYANILNDSAAQRKEVKEVINTMSELKTFSDDSIEIKLSKYLFKKIKENNPKVKEPNLQIWAKHISLMIRIDKREAIDIKDVIDWCQDDNFWQSNILSAQKLREKFDQLYTKMVSINKSNKLGQKSDYFRA